MADNLFGYATTSWYLGEGVSHIELNTEKVTEEQMAKIEETANEKIRDATPVHIEEFEASDPRLKEVYLLILYTFLLVYISLSFILLIRFSFIILHSIHSLLD